MAAKHNFSCENMMNEDVIKKYVEEHKYMWTSELTKHALIRMGEHYTIYNKETSEIYGTEIHEINVRIWKNMIFAGVEIMDKLPEDSITRLM
jgi:hypothetical protein